MLEVPGSPPPSPGRRRGCERSRGSSFREMTPGLHATDQRLPCRHCLRMSPAEQANLRHVRSRSGRPVQPEQVLEVRKGLEPPRERGFRPVAGHVSYAVLERRIEPEDKSVSEPGVGFL